jgi:hypothetical protein
MNGLRYLLPRFGVGGADNVQLRNIVCPSRAMEGMVLKFLGILLFLTTILPSAFGNADSSSFEGGWAFHTERRNLQQVTFARGHSVCKSTT